MPTALGRLKTILRRGLDATAALWPEVRVAYGWVHRAAHILNNDVQCTEAAVKRRLHGLLGAMRQHQAKAGTLAPAVGHFLKVSRSYWPGLFHCRSYWIPGSYVPIWSEKHNSFLWLLKNKGFKEGRVTKIKLYALGASKTLESNKSLSPWLSLWRQCLIT